MISDVLSDAVQEVNRYRRDMADVYGQHREDLAALCRIMESVRDYLDTPEPTGRMLNPDLLRNLADWLDNPDHFHFLADES